FDGFDFFVLARGGCAACRSRPGRAGAGGTRTASASAATTATTTAVAVTARRCRPIGGIMARGGLRRGRAGTRRRSGGGIRSGGGGPPEEFVPEFLDHVYGFNRLLPTVRHGGACKSGQDRLQKHSIHGRKSGAMEPILKHLV